MSANKTGIYQAVWGYYKHCFYSSVPIPAYLTALVVGNLEYASTGPNTGILASPAIIDAAAAEFVDLQDYLNTAESYVG
jgi:aminopeptidase N